LPTLYTVGNLQFAICYPTSHDFIHVYTVTKVALFTLVIIVNFVKIAYTYFDNNYYSRTNFYGVLLLWQQMTFTHSLTHSLLLWIVAPSLLIFSPCVDTAAASPISRTFWLAQVVRDFPAEWFQSWCGVSPYLVILVFTQASEPYVQVCYQANDEDGMTTSGYGAENILEIGDR